MAPLSGGHRGGHWCQLSPGSCGWPACGRGDIPARGCRLSPPCGGTPPAPPFLTPAPRPCASLKQLLPISPPPPIATSGPHLGRGGGGVGARWSGGFRGCGGPGGSPGARDEGGRCLGDGAGAGTAAKGCGSCAGWRWLGGAGGTRGFRVPPSLEPGPPLPCSGDWRGGSGGDPSLCCRWDLLGSRPPDLGAGVSGTLGVASGGGWE